MKDTRTTSLVIDTPTGLFSIIEEDGRITRAHWANDERAPTEALTPLLSEAAEQLAAYFAGDLHRFNLPLAPEGSPFQNSVWREMSAIPYGVTRTYGDLAKAIRGEARAVGTACGANPIPIIIPCHRVVGADGEMTGFSGGRGVETKVALLKLEGAMLL